MFADSARLLAQRVDITLPSTWQVSPESWYPLEMFERVSLAYLHLVGLGDAESFAAQGGRSLDALLEKNPALVERGDARESVMRSLVLRQTFFDFPAVTVRSVTDTDAQLKLDHGMKPIGEQAASLQTVGFLTRTLELCGATKVESKFLSRAWAGDPETLLEMSWTLTMQ
jgi:hypothetical protein